MAKNMVVIMPWCLHQGHVSWHNRHDHGLTTAFYAFIKIKKGNFTPLCKGAYAFYIQTFATFFLPWFDTFYKDLYKSFREFLVNSLSELNSQIFHRLTYCQNCVKFTKHENFRGFSNVDLKCSCYKLVYLFMFPSYP